MNRSLGNDDCAVAHESHYSEGISTGFPETREDSGEAERSFRKESERHSGMNPEHHRSVATLAHSIMQNVFGFVKENLSGA